MTTGNPVDTAATHLANALQVVTGVMEDELRTISYKVDGQSCHAITVEELDRLQARIRAALQDMECA